MSWKFQDETRVGAESALDACDYFVDEVIEPWKIMGNDQRDNQFMAFYSKLWLAMLFFDTF